ncbi:hypothetical protein METBISCDRAFT_27952 [Metschnikowia bicuspidata]|uniref:PQ-loop-domain-containing protein n=1 Tax=Metschnikowia bicuspidata TaxID=27322 RepID=A0A4P9ZAG8_9ASCO|nr:hypothetical protein METBISCDRAFT_27952 [Metschnikowia bicuspidata]
MQNPDCSAYAEAPPAMFSISVLITVGIFISYLPQYRRIVQKQTSEGLSVNFLLLGSCSLIFTFTNIVLMSSRALYCCRVGSLLLFDCLNSQINLFQIGLQSTCAVAILGFVIAYTRTSVRQDRAEFARIMAVARLVAIHAILLVLQMAVAFATSRGVLLALAQFNGLMSTGLTVIKYVPQILETYRLKHPGTLSIGMMSIQTPGGFVFTASLFFTKNIHWSSWISYFVAAMLQGFLLVLCIYYEYFTDYRSVEAANVERIVEENTQES